MNYAGMAEDPAIQRPTRITYNILLDFHFSARHPDWAMRTVRRLSLLFLIHLSLISFSRGAEFYEDERLPARNPTELHLFSEPGKLQRWISGLEDHADEEQVAAN